MRQPPLAEIGREVVLVCAPRRPIEPTGDGVVMTSTFSFLKAPLAQLSDMLVTHPCAKSRRFTYAKSGADVNRVTPHNARCSLRRFHHLSWTNRC